VFLPASRVTASGVTPNSKSSRVSASSSGAGRPPAGRSATGAVVGTGTTDEERPPAERVAAEPSVEADLESERVPTDSEKEVAVPCRILCGVRTGVATIGKSPSSTSRWVCMCLQRRGWSEVAQDPGSGDTYCAPPVVGEEVASWRPRGWAHPARAGKETTRTYF
jgi:hypothetical protein